MTSTSDRTIEQRLDAQARAIRELRAEVKDLRAALSEARIPEPLSDEPSPAVKPVPFQHRSTCLDCGREKEHDRFEKSLCDTCARRNFAAQQEGTPIRYSKCGVCGKALNGTVRPMCGKCEHARRLLMAK
jgi:NMD protein affecting ribosome stability and mRNA decay